MGWSIGAARRLRTTMLNGAPQPLPLFTESESDLEAAKPFMRSPGKTPSPSVYSAPPPPYTGTGDAHTAVLHSMHKSRRSRKKYDDEWDHRKHTHKHRSRSKSVV